MRSIGLFSSGRHDWGYLVSIIRELAACDDIKVVIFRACDSLTADELSGIPAGVACGQFSIFPAGREVSPALVAEVTGGFAECLARNPVDILVVVGDRVETLAVCTVAVAGGVVLAHIHGGDRAPGELDDSNRHAITKLSHVHFPATEESAGRIARLGEQQWRIHTVGSPGLDSILSGGLADSATVARVLGQSIENPYVVLLYHASGLGDQEEAHSVGQICKALENQGLMSVCIAGNRDSGSGNILKVIDKFSCRCKWPIVPTLARDVFLRLVRDALALVGNSSSGMIESAAVDGIVLNVGDRQKGRQRSANVIDVPAEAEAIERQLERLKSDSRLREQLRSAACVFGDGRASASIAATLGSLILDRRLRIKLIEY